MNPIFLGLTEEIIPLYTVIGLVVLAGLIGLAIVMHIKRVAGLKEEIGFWQGVSENAWRHNDTLLETRAKWTKLFGPDPTLYDIDEKKFIGWDHNKGTVAVDLDGVIAAYDEVWRGPDHFGNPLPGAIRGMKVLKDLGFRITIYSTRINPMAPGQGRDALRLAKGVQDYLNKWGIPHDYVSLFKPLAAYYLDDRAVRFHSWPQALADIGLFEAMKRGLILPQPTEQPPPPAKSAATLKPKRAPRAKKAA